MRLCQERQGRRLEIESPLRETSTPGCLHPDRPSVARRLGDKHDGGAFREQFEREIVPLF